MFEAHSEQVDWLKFLGLWLVSASGLGHKLLLHKAHVTTLIGGTTGGHGSFLPFTFIPMFVLNRGVTPAVISDIAISQDGVVAVASSKGTVHLFKVPTKRPASADASLAGNQTEADARITVNAFSRIKLGSLLGNEALLPAVHLVNAGTELLITSRTGIVSGHKLSPEINICGISQ
jgi:hypothetical protein